MVLQKHNCSFVKRVLKTCSTLYSGSRCSEPRMTGDYLSENGKNYCTGEKKRLSFRIKVRRAIRKTNLSLWSSGDGRPNWSATGLACTEVGGDTLKIEVAVLPGKGKLILTGKLGDVMKESAQAAFSYIRSKVTEFGLIQIFMRKMIFIFMFLKVLFRRMDHPQELLWQLHLFPH